MLADLDLLLIAVFCAADDLLPKARNNAKRIVTDAEVITLCVAQAIMGITFDPRFLAVARKRLIHLFPVLRDRAGFYKRREALSDTIEALIAKFAARSPGSEDDMLLVDSTPVECALSRETVKRGGDSALADALSDGADYGYCASHSRFFYGFRLHTLFAIDSTLRAVALTSAKVDEKEVCLQLVARCRRQPGQFLTLIGDKNFRGKEFETKLAALNATIIRPQRRDERTAPATTTTESASSTPALRPAAQITPQPRRTDKQPSRRISRQSVSGSNRSTGPPRTSSPSNATVPEPCTASEPASLAASSHSPPRSSSTTNSVSPAGRSSSTSPELVELLI